MEKKRGMVMLEKNFEDSAKEAKKIMPV